MSSISVSRSTLDRHVLNDGRVSMTIDVEDGFSSITLHLDGGESIEFSRSLLPQVSGICAFAMNLLWAEYPGVAPEIVTPTTHVTESPQTVPYTSPLAGTLTPTANAVPRPQERPQINVPAGYGEPAPKPQAREGLPATERQVGFIDNLGQALHLSLDELLAHANQFEPGLESFDDIAGMDRRKASQLIEHLKTELENEKALAAEGSVPS